MTAYKSVNVRFPGSRVPRWYLIPEGDEPKLGDLVLTSVTWKELAIQKRGPLRDMVVGLKVGQVMSLSLKPPPMNGRTYLHLIAVDTVKRRDEENRTIHAQEDVKAAAREELNKMLSDSDRVELYRALAEKNDRAAELIKIIDED